MSFIHWLLRSSFVQAFFTKEVRHLATAAAGALASWLVAHGGQQSDVTNITEGLTALLVGAGGYGLSMMNASGNEARIQVAAQTGLAVPKAQANAIMQQGVVAQQKADTGQAEKVQAIIDKTDAAAPTTKAKLLDDLAAGGPK